MWQSYQKLTQRDCHVAAAPRNDECVCCPYRHSELSIQEGVEPLLYIIGIVLGCLAC
jgi:hypothetical protein